MLHFTFKIYVAYFAFLLRLSSFSVLFRFHQSVFVINKRYHGSFDQNVFSLLSSVHRGRNSSLVVFELAVHNVAGSILLWGNFPVEGIFPLELT